MRTEWIGLPEGTALKVDKKIIESVKAEYNRQLKFCISPPIRLEELLEEGEIDKLLVYNLLADSFLNKKITTLPVEFMDEDEGILETIYQIFKDQVVSLEEMASDELENIIIELQPDEATDMF